MAKEQRVDDQLKGGPPDASEVARRVLVKNWTDTLGAIRGVSAAVKYGLSRSDEIRTELDNIFKLARKMRKAGEDPTTIYYPFRQGGLREGVMDRLKELGDKKLCVAIPGSVDAIREWSFFRGRLFYTEIDLNGSHQRLSQVSGREFSISSITPPAFNTFAFEQADKIVRMHPEFPKDLQ